ncbi:DUF3626 domain-containing protein [Flammeovirga sp. SJP92]|uniref:DUF3626 domain-containing protein n=1 Tax=Flammeovirga sp. SJP92 TaxID=1775430 RepID=UPI0007894B4F|nr:DUF3626 domain-containing protein [Flammeovirga sp. SJP92]KXX71824.1 hypothetical protein AVL50_03295 [Flammeovirga sp. SJP92]
MKLTKSQALAIKNVLEYINTQKEKSIDNIEMILYQSNLPKDSYQAYINNVREKAPIALHFHPDRIFSGEMNVIEGMVQSGIYKNQYETKISAGSVSAFTGGGRDDWENIVFKGAYHSASPLERPKYGALNLTMTNDGPSPRFGSCYFLLKSEVKNRSTFTYGDTYDSPKEIGTIEHFELIHSAILKDLFTREMTLGERNLSVQDFLNLINEKLSQFSNSLALRPASKNLDFYIETQVHGDISLERDVEKVIADLSYKGTEIEFFFKKLCEKYNIELIWNSGLELEVSAFPNNFRGPEVPVYAKKLEKSGKLNAYLLGKIAKELDVDHKNLQMLKYLWHCIVRFGHAIK